MNRRRFTLMATGGLASSALVGCSGEAVEDDLTPTRIADVEGAPPTLAPNATPFDSGGGSESDGSGDQQASGGGAITVTGLDELAYDPSSFEASPGQAIHFVNGGALQHDFNLDELDMHTALLDGGGEEELTVPDDAEVGAEFTYYCSVPGHREGGMEGTMTVVEAGAGGSADEQATPEEEAATTGSGEAITVTGLDELAFDPSSFEASPGQTIHFVNGGALQHDFNIDELDMHTALLDGGGEEELTVPDDAEVGTEYTYYCSVPGHREGGMEGTMTVVEAGGAAGSESESGGSSDQPATEAASSGGGEAITVTGMDTLAFDPSSFEASPGQTIHFVNGGALQHDFNIDELDIHGDLLDGGGEEDLTVPDDAEVGTEYTYYCSVAGHQAAGMEGVLTIV
jgi:plastocyanin